LHRNNQSPPPWDLLLGASRNTLQAYELSRLNHAANIAKEIKQLLDSYIEESFKCAVGAPVEGTAGAPAAGRKSILDR